MNELSGTDAEAALSPTTERLAALRSVWISERVAIAVGGAAGAYARVILSEEIGPPGTGWPWATFCVNIAGAFLLGYLTTRLAERLPPSTYRRPFVATGFCGALTTFSTLQFELLNLIQTGHAARALAYGTVTVIGGFAAMLTAIAIVRRVRVAR